MSGAQGAQPPGSLTSTTYGSIPEPENKPRLNPRSNEDEGMVKVEKLQDNIDDPVGVRGCTAFQPTTTTTTTGAGKEDKPDSGVTGTA